MPNKKLNPVHSDKRLTRNVALALACKIAIIACLGFLFFGSDNRISVNDEVVSQRLLLTDQGKASVPDKP